MLSTFDARPITAAEKLELRRDAHNAKRRWERARRAAIDYERQLRRVAQAVGELVRGRLAESLDQPYEAAQVDAALADVERMLRQYALLLGPWARAVARRMLTEVDRREKSAWIAHAHAIGREIRKELESAPTGIAYREGMDRQVALITSLPLEAAQRVHQISTNQMYSGLRGKGLVEEIMQTGEVTKSRARLIARTEVARATTELTKARAEYVGSEAYEWMSAQDEDVRPRHRQLNGTIHRWDDPPVASEPGQQEMRYHPGGGPNCRCVPIPILSFTED